VVWLELPVLDEKAVAEVFERDSAIEIGENVEFFHLERTEKNSQTVAARVAKTAAGRTQLEKKDCRSGGISELR